MSGLVAEVDHPRAVIVALHGGASHSAYFDSPSLPRHSLLQTGAALGFTVVAPDRLGYGRSAGWLRGMPSADQQVEVTFAAVERMLGAGSRGAGIFLVGHSQGCVLAMRMAAADRGATVLGLELAGTGIRHAQQSVERMERFRGDVRKVLEILWQPACLYPDQDRVASRAPDYEGIDARSWPDEFARLAASVTLPIRYTLGDHEAWWQPGDQGLAEVAALFRASPRVVTHEQVDASHNLSLGLAARAYHLSLLAFVEECVLAREVAGSTVGEKELQYVAVQDR
ncbi:alpha/beta hydrolase [Rhodococcus ruber]|nr:alpha/beta fold hydrolase [Rhodococcus ruber]